MDDSIFIGRKVSQETRNFLLQENISFKEQALINIELNNVEFLTIDELKSKALQFVITSHWAAFYLEKYQSEIGLTSADTIFCISEKQKEKLKDFSNNIFISEQQNAESLAELVLQKNIPKPVVFLCGNKSLDIVESKLSLYKFGFKSVEVYKNTPVFIGLKKKYKVYAFFSPGAVESFIQAGNTIPENAKIVCIGNTTAKTCLQHYKNEIEVSEKQDELSVIQLAVKQLETTSKLIEY